MLRELLDKGVRGWDMQGQQQQEEREQEGGFANGSSGGGDGKAGEDNDGARSIRTIVPRELERMEEENEDQLVKQEKQEQLQVPGGMTSGRMTGSAG